MKREKLTKLLVTASEHADNSNRQLDELVPFVYEELHRMARAQLAREGNNATLNTTGLVHEAYLKLVDGSEVTRRGRAYFFGSAARAMRQVLVETARRRNRHKRGGGERPVTLEEDQIVIDGFAAEIADLDSALRRLEKEHPRPAKVVECRFFGGLDVDQIAEFLNVAPRTVDRDWVLARAWLSRELGGEPGASEPPHAEP